mmetsp:Transcript_20105/g.51000  ORF Transcript_20105/g.51000 Transcript_20105/m.51000 type:complete len:194 (+) Transcript_20105:622-1203(+)
MCPMPLEPYPIDLDAPEVARLEAKLQCVLGELRRHGHTDGRFFAKLECRSPKDAALTAPAFEPLFRAELAALHRGEGAGVMPRCTAAEKHMLLAQLAFCRASCGALCCRTERDALHLLLQSQRIFDDLTLALDPDRAPDAVRSEHGLPLGAAFDLLVRAWEDIDQALEVRVFVSRGAMHGHLPVQRALLRGSL